MIKNYNNIRITCLVDLANRSVNNFFNGIRTTVDKVEELVDNKDKII